MSRQFNFMPSQFVSRQVAPCHAGRSCDERDLSAGQDADKERTTGAVPRDNRGTNAAVTDDSRAGNALVTRDFNAAVGALPTASITRPAPEEHREDELRLFGYPTAREQARLDGRHGRTWWDVIEYMARRHRTDREIAAIRAAYDEGVDLRLRNVRCFCNHCLMPPEIVEREQRRWDYARRRHDELTAQGYSPTEVGKRIRDELDRGMAL